MINNLNLLSIGVRIKSILSMEIPYDHGEYSGTIIHVNNIKKSGNNISEVTFGVKRDDNATGEGYHNSWLVIANNENKRHISILDREWDEIDNMEENQ